MRTIVASLAFGSVGFGLWLIARALFPDPTPLAAIAAEVNRPRLSTLTMESPVSRWERWAARLAGQPTAGRMADLAVTERTLARHAIDKLVCAIGLPVVPMMMAVGWTAVGLIDTPTRFLVLAAAAGVGGWFTPDLLLRARAAERRRGWSHTLACYLDIVVVLLAGGSGAEEALHVAAEAGHGPDFLALRHTLTAARLRRVSPWVALDRLGIEREIRPLRELGAAMSLAGTEGSKVRSSLIAKADALRNRQLAEAESQANKSSETMTIAPAAMIGVFVLLVGYPAVASLMSL